MEYSSEPQAMNLAAQPTETQLWQSASALKAEQPQLSDALRRWSYTVAHGFQMNGQPQLSDALKQWSYSVAHGFQMERAALQSTSPECSQ